LEASLIDVGGPGNIHETSHRGLLFGTDVEYSLFNQEGTQRIPARPHVGMTEKLVDAIADEVLDFAVEQLKE
jgi:phage gpG-like protein